MLSSQEPWGEYGNMCFNLLEEFHRIFGGVSTTVYSSGENKTGQGNRFQAQQRGFLDMWSLVRPLDGAPLELDVESFVGFSSVFLIPLPSGEMKDCVRAVQTLAGLLKYPDPS